MIIKRLFTQVDNSALIIFRILFGFLVAAESFGSIFTGWITRTLIEPQFTFNFIGFDFLQPLPGDGMYYYYAVMGLVGLLIMIGFYYRYTMPLFTLLWAAVYFMQKTSYNNHYYLLFLLCVMMCFLPAERYASYDARRDVKLRSIKMPQWCSWILIFQLTIVYTYAAIAKLYPDWLDLTVVKNLMASKADYPLVGDFLQQHWVHGCIAYFGIVYDLTIIPFLLWKPTQKYAFLASIFFHLFNSFVLQIGIFPYLSLAFTLFFFPTPIVHKLFLKKKPYYNGQAVDIPTYKNVLLVVLGIWFTIQIGLPIRHWFIPGDVLWTEEGHRLSWRMMLRSRSGYSKFYIVNKETKERTKIDQTQYLSKKQLRTVATRPDAIWQFAQRLKEYYAKEGIDIAVYVDSKVRVNSSPFKVFIDPKTDLASVPWNYFQTNPWIIKYATNPPVSSKKQ